MLSAIDKMKLILIYWIITTAYGIYWLIKNPSRFDDKEDFSILDVLANIFPAALVSWIAIPILILGSIKFKRHKKQTHGNTKPRTQLQNNDSQSTQQDNFFS